MDFQETESPSDTDGVTRNSVKEGTKPQTQEGSKQSQEGQKESLIHRLFSRKSSSKQSDYSETASFSQESTSIQRLTESVSEISANPQRQHQNTHDLNTPENVADSRNTSLVPNWTLEKIVQPTLDLINDQDPKIKEDLLRIILQYLQDQGWRTLVAPLTSV